MAIFKGTCTQGILPKEATYFKEEEISEILTIPCEKPDIENILSVIVSPEIEDLRIVETEVGKSNEGQVLTGSKLVIELRLKEKITYVADEPTQSVHAAHYENLKSFFVIVPNEIDGHNVCDLLRANRISVNSYVESVHTRKLDCRNIFKCILLFIDVKFC
ncbi:DUF3794 domain-containing protein [Clostridium taeniosporum]|uniref:SipL SPOCS domain-containing protein n=1 Tax=Clostridium taeniosporum TaxID=394958 RepID=A0A1D7XLF1_9CLOT|nr:DUF3794 domain-containing protein [Clostridium taeniosporum]AOR24020.1 hypothetical protein BGI42_09885 [Clostridium taeniosporum]